MSSNESAAVGRPLVAIVVSVYNKAAFVAETITSVVEQTYSAIELVIVDDGSTDDSLAIVRELVGTTAARVVTLDNGGVSRARNVGFSHVSPGVSYVLFLDADDLLLPDAVRCLVDHLEQHPSALACYSDLVFVDADGNRLTEVPDQTRWARTWLGRRKIGPAEHVTPLEAVWSRFWALPSSLLIRRAAFDRIAGWDSELCRPARPFHAEDKDLAIQLALLGELHHLDDRLLQYRVLPSVHKNALYEGLKELDAKWLAAPLSSEHRRRVRQAIWFDARVHLLDAAAAVGAPQRSGDTNRIRRVADVARSMTRFASTGLRMRLRRRRYLAR